MYSKTLRKFGYCLIQLKIPELYFNSFLYQKEFKLKYIRCILGYFIYYHQ